MPLCLASRSPRRRQLLTDAGILHRVVASKHDDGELMYEGRHPEQWVMALAYLKARSVLSEIHELNAMVLGADTVCVHGDMLLGKPRDEADARRMIEQLSGSAHQTITGCCIIHVERSERLMFHDATNVAMGALRSQDIERYVSSGEWAGKAGGYNLHERIGAGWPIQIDGDPTTVMGLPMRRLLPILHALEVPT